jgi:hypothetical protein
MYRWILDLDPANTGDVTYEEFNTYGNVAKRVYDNGGFMLADYDTETANKYSEQYYNASWGWEKSIVFWGDRDGTMRYQWIPDADPGNTGNEVFYEYDDKGRMIKKQYDDGAFTRRLIIPTAATRVRPVLHRQLGWQVHSVLGR